MPNINKCPFSDKECPVLNKDVEVKECPLVITHTKDNRECAFLFIARNLDGLYQVMHQWVVDWRKEKKIST